MMEILFTYYLYIIKHFRIPIFKFSSLIMYPSSDEAFVSVFFWWLMILVTRTFSKTSLWDGLLEEVLTPFAKTVAAVLFVVLHIRIICWALSTSIVVPECALTDTIALIVLGTGGKPYFNYIPLETIGVFIAVVFSVLRTIVTGSSPTVTGSFPAITKNNRLTSRMTETIGSK